MMKRLLIICSLAILNVTAFGQRYLNEIFTNADLTVTPNVTYANNFQFLTGTATATDLKLDVYAPSSAVDPVSARPVIVYLPTGSFLPPVANGTPTGSRTDSAVVEMCRQFARRGYVAMAVSYRLGWNPVAPDQDIRTGSLLQAVYRSIQDAKACVRFIHKTAAAGNTYKVDTNAIIIGGQGSGGYIALAYATLDKTAELNLPKFLANTTNATYHFTQGQSYINQTFFGDFEGFGGTAGFNNPNNSAGYTSTAHFAFNLGGALGDSSWLEPGDIPMVAFHVIGDPFAPFGNGPVIVPTTGQFVVNVSGSQWVIDKAGFYGNNSCFSAAGFTDPYTVRANQLNGGDDGLFPFETNPTVQAGPWEWFDLPSLQAYATALGYPASQGDTVYNNALYTNPNMSKAKALAYIDTIQHYLNPRVVYCLNLLSGINENQAVATSLTAFPNPSGDRITLNLSQKDNSITDVKLFDITGRMSLSLSGMNHSSMVIERKGIEAGIYFAVVNTEHGTATLKLIFN
jgi:hypothetical protein